MATKYTEYIELPLSFEKSIKIIKFAVEQNHKLIDIDESKGIIFGEVKISFSSFGEYLLIKVSPNQNNTSSLIYFESECKIPTTLVDYGKNKRNITKLIGILKQLAEIA